ncbi:hypothetical protein ABZV29_42335 [Streptomyces sp. NPDC005236]|uniref:hypothetical protein n=1 Tax=Streptomyces sp. NPDC005236 TaxID=3157028 RepID=UPI0033A2FD67
MGETFQETAVSLQSLALGFGSASLPRGDARHAYAQGLGDGSLGEAGCFAHQPMRPKPVRIRRPGEPLTPEEIDLRERLQAQPHPNAENRSSTP